MAPATTAAAVFVLLDRAVFASDVIALAFEIVCMAGSAEGRVLRPAERDVLIVAGMARATADVAAVIARIPAARWVGECDRSPSLSVVAQVAFRRRHEMVVQALGLTAGCDVAIVTRAAAVGDALVIPTAAREGRSGVAGGAVERRGNVVV